MDVAAAWVLIVAILTTGTTAVLVAMFRSAGKSKQVTPAEALKLRFANGEITEADYFRSLAVLEHDKLLELED